MGLMLSVVISYAGINETIECIRHILAGILPDTDPDFQDLVEYYSTLLQKQTRDNPGHHWSTECGQGYLCLTEDKNGKLKSAAVKYYDGQPDSTAILFSTKISSFGQESVDEISQANGDYKSERYLPTKTKTLISNTSESFNVGNRNRSPTSCEKISDPNRYSANSSERDDREGDLIKEEKKEKLTWHYSPLSPTPDTLPEIHFQSYDGDQNGDNVYNEDYLRSLDGLKFRPLQRSDPSGRRRSFKKRHSSSSSSRDSRASREEELKMFTSLEEAEFERMTKDEKDGDFGSTPNLVARSYSRSRSRENSREPRNEKWSTEGSVDSVPGEDMKTELKPKLKDLPKLGSFEEKEEIKGNNEVNQEEDDDDDFWGNSGD